MRIGHRPAISTAFAVAMPMGRGSQAAEDIMLAGSAGRVARDGGN